VGRDASLDHVVLQQQGADAWQLSATAVQQEAGSRFSSHSIALGGRLARLDLRCTLAGEGAHAGLLGLYLARDRQLLDHHTTIDHATPHTTSDELYKGILDERAVAVFHGRIHVRPHAQKTSAMQQNRNLLLSDAATIHTKPQLEIHADDVRCSHGATIGQLDPDQLFYLRARGIWPDDARALLMLAFASEVLEKLPAPALRERLGRLALDWLPRRNV
jgi:Fe-S cluster assembly protein SufD